MSAGQVLTLPFGTVQRARMILHAWTGLVITHGRVGRAVSPGAGRRGQAIAYEPPRSHELPLSRLSPVELHRPVIERGVTEASASTIWRWRHEDAIKPSKGWSASEAGMARRRRDARGPA